MKVSELINNLSAYASQSPKNAEAEVMISGNEICYGIDRADDYKGIMGMTFVQLLVLVPDGNVKIPIKEIKRQ